MQTGFKTIYKGELKLQNIETSETEENIVKFNKNFFYHFIKRLIDLCFSIMGVIILSPGLIIISIIIKIDSNGPIIFSQKRVGKNGKIFKMYKFRSMVVNAEDLFCKLREKNEMSGPMFKIKDDPRITKFGKLIRRTSLDELPQLFNIVRGEMSLVGPRPNLPKEVAEFNNYQKLKLLAKPGLTCYWQVMGRNEIDFEDWMKLDIKYIEERNIFIDLKLIFDTFWVLFGDKNAR